MVAKFPNKIKFVSDDNEAILAGQVVTKSSNIAVAYYEYVVSKNNKGVKIPMTLDDINRLLSFKLLEILEN